jgi:hypothetical protein
LLAAAFHALIPPAPIPPDEGSLRDRLIAALEGFSDLIAEAPISLAAMSWLALGGDLEHVRWGDDKRSESTEVRSLRERVAEQYAAPFDVIFGSPVALAEVGEIDRTRAAVLLLGPIVLGKLSTLPDFDYREITEAVVDGFLATHARTSAPDA